MTENKNIIKGNKQVDRKVNTKRNFYAVIEINDQSFVETFLGERIEARNKLESSAKRKGGKVAFFGALN
jgi:hypothetical protein